MCVQDTLIGYQKIRTKKEKRKKRVKKGRKRGKEKEIKNTQFSKYID